MKNHIANYYDIVDYVSEALLFSSAGRNENKRLTMHATVSDKRVFFKVTNYVDKYEKEHENLESAIEDYNNR